MAQSNRLVINGFIAVILFLTVVDILPPLNRFHRNLKNTLDIVYDVTGLWQGPWDLFSPDPDCINVKLSAKFYLSDGTTGQWESPSWYGAGPWTKFTHFRFMEYIDSIRMEQNKSGWPPLASYLARRHSQKSGAKVQKVVLTRHWHIIKPPLEHWEPYGKYPGYPQKYDFFTWTAP